LFDGLSLWLAIHEPRWCTLSERTTALAPRLRDMPLLLRDTGVTIGIVDGTSVAVLALAATPGELIAIGHGPRGAGLAAELVAHVRAWDAAGRPGTQGLRIDAYPKPTPGAPVAGAIEKTHTRLVLSRAPQESHAIHQQTH
jgi:protein-L-isoaspartate(D-aspartate) O-methyltransferase